MKKINTKIYRIRKGELRLEIIRHSIYTGQTVNRTTYMVAENGSKYKSAETKIEAGKTVSQSYFSKEGAIKWEERYEYYDSGVLKKRITIGANGEVTYFKNQILDKDGNLIFADESNGFSFYSTYLDEQTGKRIETQTTYEKGQPYMATSHRVTVFNGQLIENIKEYEEFTDTEEGFYPSQNNVESQFEYYANGNKKRNSIYSYEQKMIAGKYVTSRFLSQQESFDKQGLLLEVKKGNIANEMTTLKSYEYHFNNKAEWIERKCYHGDELVELSKREIEEVG